MLGGCKGSGVKVSEAEGLRVETDEIRCLPFVIKVRSLAAKALEAITG